MAALPAIMDGRLRKYLRRNRILFVVSVIARQTANLVSRLLIRTEPPSCDTCAFVEFFRSNGDGQVSRLNTFCRCAGGPYEDRAVPQARQCARWQRAELPAAKPDVGDPTLTT